MPCPSARMPVIHHECGPYVPPRLSLCFSVVRGCRSRPAVTARQFAGAAAIAVMLAGSDLQGLLTAMPRVFQQRPHSHCYHHCPSPQWLAQSAGVCGDHGLLHGCRAEDSDSSCCCCCCCSASLENRGAFPQTILTMTNRTRIQIYIIHQKHTNTPTHKQHACRQQSDICKKGKPILCLR